MKLKFLLKSLENLVENRSAPLYHWLTPEKTLIVLTADAIEENQLWSHEIPGRGEVKGTSFTRNPKLKMDHPPRTVRLTIDQQKLSTRFKIIPIDGELVFHHTRKMKLGGHTEKQTMNYAKLNVWPKDRGRNANFVWAEEFVIGPIKELHRYIEKIEVNHDIKKFSKVEELVERTCKSYSEKYNIKLSIA